eukprot:m.1219665 g.1219665  ORF g.1219665 m.1219665 type:complete len:347 (+) comp24622_c0_seq20:2680-3720(+)
MPQSDPKLRHWLLCGVEAQGARVVGCNDNRDVPVGGGCDVGLRPQVAHAGGGCVGQTHHVEGDVHGHRRRSPVKHHRADGGILQRFGPHLQRHVHFRPWLWFRRYAGSVRIYRRLNNTCAMRDGHSNFHLHKHMPLQRCKQVDLSSVRQMGRYAGTDLAYCGGGADNLVHDNTLSKRCKTDNLVRQDTPSKRCMTDNLARRQPSGTPILPVDPSVGIFHRRFFPAQVLLWLPSAKQSDLPPDSDTKHTDVPLRLNHSHTAVHRCYQDINTARICINCKLRKRPLARSTRAPTCLPVCISTKCCDTLRTLVAFRSSFVYQMPFHSSFIAVPVINPTTEHARVYTHNA